MKRALAAAFRKAGLGRPELRGWALYDWANSAFVTVITTAIFPIYYAQVASAGVPEATATARYGTATSLALGVIALLAPVLGTLADFTARKKRFLGAFLGLGVTGTACLFLVDRGDWMLGAVLFFLANVGASGSFVFYDALLPHVAEEDELDRVATSAFALGYVGGGVLLALNLAWIMNPGIFGLPAEGTLPTRLAFLSVALWWGLFSIPLFRNVSEPPRRVDPGEDPAEKALKVTFRRLRRTLSEIRDHRNAFLLLLAFLLYNDGINTIIRFATVYGTELGMDREVMIGAILIVQFVGIPFAFLFGSLAERIGTRPAIGIGLAVYVGVAVGGYFIQTETHFVILAVVVAMVQGGTQALSRSLFASLIPKHKSGEFFGFFGVLNKAAAVLGPTAFTAAVALTGSSRYAILSIVVFFVAGGALLLMVDVDEGRRAARDAEEEARRVAAAAGEAG